MPASDAAREDIQDHRQVHELLAQPDVGDVAYPDLLGTHDFQLLNQVRITRKPMLAVRCAMFGGSAPDNDAKLAHEALDVLAVDLEALSLQLGG